MNFSVRTDLALENREIYKEAAKNEDEIPGINATFDTSEEGISITRVSIFSEEGSNALGKPIGEYITIESPFMNDEVIEFDEKITKKVSEFIKELGHLTPKDGVLVVGLGNSDVTPDALGPKTIDNLTITRHLLEYSPDLLPGNSRPVSAIVPGVLGTTGIDTCDIIKGIVEKTTPNLVIVIDALAAKEASRVSKTIQLSNAGIVPGAGVKNNRNKISKETLGVPVIAIGVPTVVSAHSLINEATKNKVELEENKFDFMVTPNTIDDMITTLSRLLADGINQALLPALNKM